MQATKILVSLALLSFVIGCAGSKVHTDFDPEHSFANYKKFAWVGAQPMLVEGERGPGPLISQRLKDAIKQGFEAKGFQYVNEPANADFVVAFTVGAREKINITEHEVEAYLGPFDLGWRRDRFGFGLPTRRITVTETREYTEGSLAIDVYDVREKKPVWHSGASQRLSSSNRKNNSPETLANAVSALLERFPPDLQAN